MAAAARAIPRLVARRLPIFYGWVVLAALCCAGFARQGPAVATLSIFVEPLTHAFGWSRTALSGAVSLGGVLAAIASPLLGPLLDRYGSRLLLSAAVLLSAAMVLLLSLTGSLWMFYLLFCTARMIWAGPFDLGIYGAVNDWFVRRRRFAIAIATLAQMAGLVAMPLFAQLAIAASGWRAGWLAIGITMLTVGFVPVRLFLVRRPEDLGLAADRDAAAGPAARTPPPASEASFSRKEALRLPAFWLLLLYTVLLYPVQAGVSLHQAANLVERGIDPTIAATIVSSFPAMSAVASFACGVLPRRLPVRYPLAVAALLLGLSSAAMIAIASPRDGYIAAALFGLGIGGLLTLLPLAWADYFGPAHYGAIRGAALSAQVLAQAAGPLLSGLLRDWTGDYRRALECFAALSFLAVFAALAARQPRTGRG